MTERAKKIYRAWEDKWVETYKFPNQEESSLAAATLASFGTAGWGWFLLIALLSGVYPKSIGD